MRGQAEGWRVFSTQDLAHEVDQDPKTQHQSEITHGTEFTAVRPRMQKINMMWKENP